MGDKSSPISFQSQSPFTKPQNRVKSQVWDCGSSLYDSFELQSLKRQLDSAIIASSRSFSMPHLSNRRPPPPPEAAESGKKSSKLSRSLRKLLRSVFRPSKPDSDSSSRFQSKNGLYVVCDKTGELTTIPEVSETNCIGISPVIDSITRKAASARFAGISCTL